MAFLLGSDGLSKSAVELAWSVTRKDARGTPISFSIVYLDLEICEGAIGETIISAVHIIIGGRSIPSSAGCRFAFSLSRYDMPDNLPIRRHRRGQNQFGSVHQIGSPSREVSKAGYQRSERLRNLSRLVADLWRRRGARSRCRLRQSCLRAWNQFHRYGQCVWQRRGGEPPG